MANAFSRFSGFFLDGMIFWRANDLARPLRIWVSSLLTTATAHAVALRTDRVRACDLRFTPLDAHGRSHSSDQNLKKLDSESLAFARRQASKRPDTSTQKKETGSIWIYTYLYSVYLILYCRAVGIHWTIDIPYRSRYTSIKWWTGPWRTICQLSHPMSSLHEKPLLRSLLKLWGTCAAEFTMRLLSPCLSSANGDISGKLLSKLPTDPIRSSLQIESSGILRKDTWKSLKVQAFFLLKNHGFLCWNIDHFREIGSPNKHRSNACSAFSGQQKSRHLFRPLGGQ